MNSCIRPLVTVIIPVYNEERHLAETIDSVLNQTFQNFNIYISDNQSKDTTVDIANAYKRIDDRVKVFVQKSHVPAHSNFKFLIDSVSSPYVMILGGHDKIHIKCLENCLLKFTDNKTVCVFPKAQFFGLGQRSGDANSSIDLNTDNVFLRAEKLLKNLSYGTAVYSMYRTSIIKNVIISPIKSGDLNLLFQVVLKGCILCTDDFLYFRREDRIENSKERNTRHKEYVGMKSLGFAPIVKALFDFILCEKNISNVEKIKLGKLALSKYQKHEIIFPWQLLVYYHKISLRSFLLLLGKYLNNMPIMIINSLVRLFSKLKLS